MEFQVEPEGAENRKQLVKLDRTLTVLKGVDEALGDTRQIREFLLAEVELRAAGPDLCC